jgi:hypothetical protein
MNCPYMIRRLGTVVRIFNKINSIILIRKVSADCGCTFTERLVTAFLFIESSIQQLKEISFKSKLYVYLFFIHAFISKVR